MEVVWLTVVFIFNDVGDAINLRLPVACKHNVAS